MGWGRMMSVPVFAAVFGVLFIWTGIGRLLRSHREPGVAAAVLWGAVGVAIGLTFCAWAVWFFLTPLRHRGGE